MTKPTVTLLSVCVSVFSLWSSAATAAPAQVIIIRHGEKPAQGNELNAKGFARAAALPEVFAKNPEFTLFGSPVAIYAQKPHGANGSLRPIQTVTPLAGQLGLKVDSSFYRDDETAVARDIMNNPAYQGKMVLISWEHNAIPVMAQALGCTFAPSAWDGPQVFDRAWVITYDDGEAGSFIDVPEQALPGDSSDLRKS